MAETVPVISGLVTLDTAPFLTALGQLQAAVTASVAKMQETLGTLGLGTSTRLEASAVAAGRTSTAFRAASVEARTLSTGMDDAEASLRKTENAFNSIYRAGSQLSSFGTRLTVFGAAIQGVLGGAMAAASGFDFWARRAAAASAATDAMGNSLGSMQTQFQGVSAAIEGVAESVGVFKPADVAHAYYLWVSATNQVIDSQTKLKSSAAQLNVMLQAATMAGVAPVTMVRAMAGILGEYGASVDQTGAITAQLMNITQSTDTEIGDLIQALKMVGPSAKSMNIDVSQSIAIIGELAQANIKGSSAGRDFQRILQSVLKPSVQGSKALQEVTDAAGNTGKTWQQVLFPGNQFVGMLDKIQNGVVTQTGFIGLLNNALQHMGRAQGDMLVSQMFTQNGLRAIIPLIQDYRKGVTDGADGTKQGANEMESFAQQLSNGALQTKLFNDKWDQVKQSIEVVTGQQLTRLKFGLIDLGEAAKGAVVPFLTTVANIVEGVRNWASQNSALFMEIIKIAGAVGGAAIAIGTMGVVLGTLTQAVSNFSIVGSALKVVWLALAEGLLPALAAFGTLAAGVLLLARVVKDSNLGKDVTAIGKAFQDLLGVLGTVVGDIIQFLNAAFHGDYKGVLKYAQDATLTFVAGIINVFDSIKTLLGQVFQDLVNWLDQTFNGLGTSMKTWGENIIAAFANGMGSAIGKYVVPAINAIIQTIANFLEGHSPAKEGPLSQVDQWGANIMNAYLGGMKNADFSNVQDVLSQVKDALTNGIGLDTASQKYNDIMTSVSNTVQAVIQGHKDLATVGQDTWDKLTATLGSGYAVALQNVISATQAVQDVKNQRSQISAQIATDQAAVHNIENTQVLPLQNQIDANNAKKEDLSLTKAGYELDKARYDSQKAALQDQITGWDEKKAAEQTVLDGYQAQIDAINQVRQGIQDQISSVNDETTAINDQISTIQRRYAEEHAQQNLSLALTKDQLDLNKSIQDQAMQPLNDQAKTLKDQITMTKEQFAIQEAPLRLQIEEMKASGNKSGAAALEKQLSMMTAMHTVATDKLTNAYDIVNHQITVATMGFNDSQKPLQDQYTAANDAKKTQDLQQKLSQEALLSDLNNQKNILADRKLALTVQLHSSDIKLHGLEALKNGVTIIIKGYDEKIAGINNAIRHISDLELPLDAHIRALDLQIQAYDLANQKLQTTIDGIRRVQEQPFKIEIQGLQYQLGTTVQQALDAAQAQLTAAHNAMTVVQAGMKKAPAATRTPYPTDPTGLLGPGTASPYNTPTSAQSTLNQALTNGLGSNGQSIIKVLNPFGGISAQVQAIKSHLAGMFGAGAGEAGGFLNGLLGHFGFHGSAPTAPGGFKGLPGRLGGSLDHLNYEGSVATYNQQISNYAQGNATFNRMQGAGASISPFILPGLAALRFPGQIGGALGGGAAGIDALLSKIGDAFGFLGKTSSEGKSLGFLRGRLAGTSGSDLTDLKLAIKALEDSMGPAGKKVYGFIAKFQEFDKNFTLSNLVGAIGNGIGGLNQKILDLVGAIQDIPDKVGGALGKVAGALRGPALPDWLKPGYKNPIGEQMGFPDALLGGKNPLARQLGLDLGPTAINGKQLGLFDGMPEAFAKQLDMFSQGLLSNKVQQFAQPDMSGLFGPESPVAKEIGALQAEMFPNFKGMRTGRKNFVSRFRGSGTGGLADGFSSGILSQDMLPGLEGSLVQGGLNLQDMFNPTRLVQSLLPDILKGESGTIGGQGSLIDLMKGLEGNKSLDMFKQLGLPFEPPRVPTIGGQGTLFDLNSLGSAKFTDMFAGGGKFDGLGGMAGGLKDLMGGGLGKLFGGIGKGAGGAGDMATGLFGKFNDFAQPLEKVGGLLKTILFPIGFIIDHGKQFEGVFTAIRTVFDGVFAVGAKVGDVLMHFVGILEKIPVLGQLFKAIPIVGEILTIVQVVETLRTAWEKNWLNIQGVVAGAWAKIQPQITAIQNLLGQNGGLLGNLSGILPHIAKILGDIVGAFVQLIGNLIQWVQQQLPAWQKTIGDTLSGIFDGLKDWWSNYGPATLATVGGFFANLIGGLLNFIINNALPWAMNLVAGFYLMVAHLFTTLDNAITSDGGVQGQGSFGDWLGTMMQRLFTWVGANYQTWAKNLFGGLSNMFGAMITLLLAASKLLLDLTVWFGKLLLGLIDYVGKNYQVWGKQIFTHFQELIGYLRDLLVGDSTSTTGGMLGKLVDWFGKLKDGLITWIQKNKDQWGSDVKDLFVQLISKMAQLLVTAALDVVVFTVWFAVMVAKLLATILSSIPGWLDTLESHFVGWITGASDKLNKDPQPGQSLFQTFVNMIGTLLTNIKNLVTTTLLPGLEDIGGSIINGIISGITKGAGNLKNALGNAISGNLTGVGGSSSTQTGQQLWMSQSGQGADAWNNLPQATKDLFNNQSKADGGSGGGVSQSADALINAANSITQGYAGYCEVFGEEAFKDATGHYPLVSTGSGGAPTARIAYNSWLASGAVHGNGTPPAGAFVYFDWNNPATGQDEGHMGISTGGGNFRSALDDGIRNLSINQYLQANTAQGAGYLGWIMPQYAKGVSSAPGGYALVGENGPEVVNLPTSSQVIPNNRLSGLTSGISDTLGAASQIAAQISQAISSGLADLNATLRVAASQPVQINKVIHYNVDSQYISSDADAAAFTQQLLWMGA